MTLEDLIKEYGGKAYQIGYLEEAIKKGFTHIALDERDRRWHLYRSEPVYTREERMWRYAFDHGPGYIPIYHAGLSYFLNSAVPEDKLQRMMRIREAIFTRSVIDLPDTTL